MSIWFSKLTKKDNVLDKRTAMDFYDQDVLLEPSYDIPAKPLPKSLTSKDEDRRKVASKSTPRSAFAQSLLDLLKWLKSFSSSIIKTDINKPLSSSTFYLFGTSSKIRIFCINICRSDSYMIAFRLVMLAFYAALTIAHFQETTMTPFDPISVVAGTVLYLHVGLQLIAYGLLGHRYSYLLRAPFNCFEFTLTISFFVPKLFFLQVLQLFRLFSLFEYLSYTRSFSSKTKIIRRSLLSLGIFAAIYILLIFLFSLLSYLIYFSEMNKYCLQGDFSTIKSRVDP